MCVLRKTKKNNREKQRKWKIGGKPNAMAKEIECKWMVNVEENIQANSTFYTNNTTEKIEWCDKLSSSFRILFLWWIMRMSNGVKVENTSREREIQRKRCRKCCASFIFSCSTVLYCISWIRSSLIFSIWVLWDFSPFSLSPFHLSTLALTYFFSRCVFIMGNTGFFMNGFLLSINIRANQSFFACVRPTNCDLHIYKYSENTKHMAKVRHGVYKI